MRRLQIFPDSERSALQLREFRWVWCGESMSLIGSQISVLALPTLLVLSLHASPLQVSFLSAAQYAALIAMMAPAGRLADSQNPRRVMMAANAARAAAVLVVAVTAILGQISVVLVICAALVIGAGQAVGDTAWSAALPRLLHGPAMAGGNSLSAQSQYLAFSVGPPIAGLLIGTIGRGPAVLVDAATFIVAAACVTALRQAATPARLSAGTESADPEEQAEKPQSRSALRYVWHTADLRAVAFASATANLGHQIIQGIYIVFVYRVLGLSPTLLGIAFGIGSAAGILGARLAAPAARRFGRGAALLLSTTLAGASWLIVLLPGPPAFVAVTAAAAIISLSMPLFGVVQATLRQEITPEDSQGIAAAGISAIALSSVPVGFLIGGVIASVVGLRIAILTGSVVAMSSGIWCVPLVARLRRAERLPANAKPSDVGDGPHTLAKLER